MTQRVDYNAVTQDGVKALERVYDHIIQCGLPKFEAASDVFDDKQRTSPSPSG